MNGCSQLVDDDEENGGDKSGTAQENVSVGHGRDIVSKHEGNKTDIGEKGSRPLSFRTLGTCDLYCSFEGRYTGVDRVSIVDVPGTPLLWVGLCLDSRVGG